MYEELIARLEAATEGDRELDADIAAVVLPGEIIWKQHRFTGDTFPSRRFQTSAALNGYASEPVENYTASLDAALTLAPEGWGFKADCGLGYGNTFTVGHVGENKFYDRPEGWGEGATPALALCIAALNARAALQGV